MLTEKTVQAVRDLSVEDVIGKYVTLKRAGAALLGLCPFHNERTPSFYVTPAKGMYYCHGCHAGGDAIKFVQEHEKKTFVEAVELIANNHNVSIEREDFTPEKKQKYDDMEQMLSLVQNAARVYQHTLKEDAGAASAELLGNRALTLEEIETYGIGLAPNDTKLFTNQIAPRGLVEPAIKAGILKKSQQYLVTQDVFINRIMFPIRSMYGNIVGFGGRRLDDDSKYPKYINSSTSDIYDKSKILYGLFEHARQIRKQNNAILVEGYLDVISLARVGFPIAVASCGTALTDEQAKLLRKSCDRVAIFRDSDNAGQKAMLHFTNEEIKGDVPILLRQGFFVDIIRAPKGHDPDSISRAYIMEDVLANREDAVLYFAKKLLSVDDIREYDINLSRLAQMLHCIPNEIRRENYIVEIQKLFPKVKPLKKQLQKLLDTAIAQKEEQDNKRVNESNSLYQIPDELKNELKFDDVKEQVEEWGFFTHKHRMYFLRSYEKSGGYYFQECSNFSIKVIQHMEDEKFPKKLIQIENTKGRKRVFESLSQNTTTLNQFKVMVEGWGNYHFTGNPADYEKLKGKLLDDMGDGRMITELGWQSEGFWCFSNGIFNADFREFDRNGIIEYEGTNYYVPSGNQLYASNKTKFVNQKLCKYTKATITLEDFMKQMTSVHGKNGMVGVTFTIACAFSDFIFDCQKSFPLVYLYGEASTGKTQMINSMMSMFGFPQTYITITGKANTDKAKIRKFAQFNNQMVCLEEYRRSVSDDVNEMLKGLLNRYGYERGNIDSAYGTESVPISSGVIITGNDYPTFDSLVTRLIILEFDKSEFTDEEKREYQKLLAWIQRGYSSLLGDIVKHRKRFEEKFQICFNEAMKEMSQLMMGIDCPSRMIENPAVLLAIYKVLKDVLNFPFKEIELIEYLSDSMIRQNNKRDTSGDVQHWWDCFLTNIKPESGKQPALRISYEYDITDDELIIRAKECHLKYQQTHYTLFREIGHTFSTMMDKLSKSHAFKKTVDSHRYGNAKSSGHVFDLSKLNPDVVSVLNDLKASYEAAKNGGFYVSAQKNENSGRTDSDTRTESNKQLEMKEVDDRPF